MCIKNAMGKEVDYWLQLRPDLFCGLVNKAEKDLVNAVARNHNKNNLRSFDQWALNEPGDQQNIKGKKGGSEENAYKISLDMKRNQKNYAIFT